MYQTNLTQYYSVVDVVDKTLLLLTSLRITTHGVHCSESQSGETNDIYTRRCQRPSATRPFCVTFVYRLFILFLSTADEIVQKQLLTQLFVPSVQCAKNKLFSFLERRNPYKLVFLTDAKSFRKEMLLFIINNVPLLFFVFNVPFVSVGFSLISSEITFAKK